MFKLLKLLTWRDCVLIFVALGFIIAGVWMDLTAPTYLAEITDLVTNPFRGGTSGEVWHQGGFMLALALGSVTCSIIVAFIAATVSSRHSARVRKEIFTHVGNMSQSDVAKFGVPSLVTRSTNDTVAVRTFIALAIQMMVRAPILAVWAILKILDASTELSLITIIAVGALALVLSVLIVIVLPRYNRIQTLTDKLNLESRENLNGIRVVRAYNANEFVEGKFEVANNALTRNNLVVNRAMAIFWPFLMMLLSVLGVVIYWVGSYMLTYGDIADPPGFFADLIVFSQ